MISFKFCYSWIQFFLRKPLLLLIFLWGLCYSAKAQSDQFQNYSIAEGLAQTQVYSMLQDSRAYLWLGTQGGGLSRFDGIEFKNLTEKEGLLSNRINALIETPSGRLLIGTSNGVQRYNGREFEDFPLSVSVQAIAMDSLENRVWIGTSKGLYTLQDSSLQAHFFAHPIDALSIQCLFADSNGVWVGTNQGVFRVQDQKLTAYGRAEGLSSLQIEAILPQANGSILLATYGSGVYALDGNRFQAVDFNQYLPSKRVTSLFQSYDSNIWIGTQDQGVQIWNPADRSLLSLDQQDGLAKNHVRQILQDDCQQIWIGTSGGGISKFGGQTFDHYDRSDGLAAPFVYAITQDSQGNIWSAAGDRGLNVFDGQSFELINQEDGFRNITSKALWTDQSGRVWIGTEGQGVFWRDSTRFNQISVQDGLSGDWIRAIRSDSLGHIWVATAGSGISKLIPDTLSLSGFRIQRFIRSDGIPDVRINALHLDKLNRLWFGMRAGGIGYLDQNGQIEIIDKQDGLPSDRVLSMAEDSTGFLWIGTRDAGLVRMPLYRDSISFSNFSYADGLSASTIFLVGVDANNQVWAGTPSGIDLLELDADRELISVQHFGREDGFKGIETCQNAVLKSLDGRLWFGTMGGLTRYNPGLESENPFPPNLKITGVNLFYKSLSETPFSQFVGDWNQLKDGLVLPWTQNHLEFEFKALNLIRPGKVTYSWKMNPLETDWSPPSNRERITYSNLRPGEYTFQVRAFNEAGISTSSPASLSFAIEPPIWQEVWFQVLIIGILSLILGTVVWTQFTRIRRKAKEKEEKLTLEKNLLELEQKALQLQMNPHFIFNALNGIQALIATQEVQLARDQLNHFSSLMRSMLNHSRSERIPLSSEIDLLDKYLSIERFNRDLQFEYSINMAVGLAEEQIDIPPMLIQPFVENAIIHGVSHLSERKGEIIIKFNLDSPNQLICIITDNGIGREASQQLNRKKLRKHQSAALEVTRERLKYMDGGGELQFEDLLDDQGKSIGTRVRLRIPI